MITCRLLPTSTTRHDAPTAAGHFEGERRGYLRRAEFLRLCEWKTAYVYVYLINEGEGDRRVSSVRQSVISVFLTVSSASFRPSTPGVSNHIPAKHRTRLRRHRTLRFTAFIAQNLRRNRCPETTKPLCVLDENPQRPTNKKNSMAWMPGCIFLSDPWAASKGVKIAALSWRSGVHQQQSQHTAGRSARRSRGRQACRLQILEVLAGNALSCPVSAVQKTCM